MEKAVCEKIQTYRAIIEPDKPSGYHGFVPSLPGCHTSGDTIEETRKNLKEAILAYLEVYFEHKDEPLSDYSYEFYQPISFRKQAGKLVAYA